MRPLVYKSQNEQDRTRHTGILLLTLLPEITQRIAQVSKLGACFSQLDVVVLGLGRSASRTGAEAAVAEEATGVSTTVVCVLKREENAEGDGDGDYEHAKAQNPFVTESHGGGVVDSWGDENRRERREIGGRSMD